MGIAGLMTGAGAAEGLQGLLKQRLLEREMALREQQAQQANDLALRRQNALEEQNRLDNERQSQQDAVLAQLRDENRTFKAAGEMPNGFPMSPAQATKFRALDLPVEGPTNFVETNPYRYGGNQPTSRATGFKEIGPYVNDRGERVVDVVDASDPARVLRTLRAPDPERGTTPYYTFPVGIDPQTSQPVVYRGNARTGTLEPVTTPNGPVQPRLSGTEQTNTNQNAAALNTLDNIQARYKPEFVGKAQGAWNQFKAGMPESLDTVTGGLPDGYPEFAAAVTANKNATIKAITGAQMSEPEAKRLAQQIPELTDRSDVFTAKMKMSRQMTTFLYRRWARADALRNAGITSEDAIRAQLNAELPIPAEPAMPTSPSTSQRVPLNQLGR